MSGSPRAATTPDMIASLGLASPELDREWADLAEGRRGFAWRNLGTSHTSLADVVAALGAAPLCAPRTGHIGDWRDILAGHTGILDYNSAICRELEIGKPLLYDFTMVETSALDAGDTLSAVLAPITGARGI